MSFHSESDDDPLAVIAEIKTVAAARQASAMHKDAELILAEWNFAINGTTLDQHSMDVALHHATVLALGAAEGITHAHHAIFWDFYPIPDSTLAVVHHDFTPKPAYFAFALAARVIGGGAVRLAAAGHEDGALDGGMGALLAGRGGDGVVRVLLVNRGAGARTATVGGMPSAVTVYDDPQAPPRAVAPSEVVTVPARSLALVEL